MKTFADECPNFLEEDHVQTTIYKIDNCESPSRGFLEGGGTSMNVMCKVVDPCKNWRSLMVEVELRREQVWRSERESGAWLALGWAPGSTGQAFLLYTRTAAPPPPPSPFILTHSH